MQSPLFCHGLYRVAGVIPALRRTCYRSVRSKRIFVINSEIRASFDVALPTSFCGRVPMPDTPIAPSSQPNGVDSSDRPIKPVGLVLGSMDATPLEFWIGVGEGQVLQL